MLYVSLLHSVSQVGVTNAIPAAGSPVPVRPAVIDLSEFTWAMSSPHGGRMTCEYGTITLRPTFFSEMAAVDGAWWPPPPVLNQITVGWYPDDGSAYWGAPELLVGWLESWDSGQVVYSLHPRQIAAITETDYHYKGTLADCAAHAALQLGLLLQTPPTRAGAVSVDWVAVGEMEVHAALDTICQYHAFFYYIIGTALYLADLLATKPSTSGYGPADFSAIAYLQAQPVRRISAPWTPEYIRQIYLEILDADNIYGTCGLTEVQISYAKDGPLYAPATVYASANDPLYPASNLIDGNPDTAWSSGGPQVPGVTLGMSISVGTLCEYALGGYLFGAYSPTRWNLYAYDEFNLKWWRLAEVESAGWDDVETRRFVLPEAQWQVWREVAYTTGATDHTIGEELTVTACHPGFYYITAALEVIEQVVTRKRVRVALPIRGSIIPSMLRLYQDPTAADGRSVESWLKVDSVTYNFGASSMVVEGYGGWA